METPSLSSRQTYNKLYGVARLEHAFLLRSEGLLLREIGARLGVSKNRAMQMVRKMIRWRGARVEEKISNKKMAAAIAYLLDRATRAGDGWETDIEAAEAIRQLWVENLNLRRRLLRDTIEPAPVDLSERDAWLLRMHRAGYRQTEMAKAMGVSYARAYQLFHRAKARLEGVDHVDQI